MKAQGKVQNFLQRFVRTFFKTFWDFIYAQLAVSAVIGFAILGTQVHFGLVEKKAIRANVIALAEPYLYVLIALAVGNLLHTSYVLYREQEEAIKVLSLEESRAKAEFETEREQTAKATSGTDWQEVADKFKELKFPVRASFETTGGITNWTFNDHGECRALCMKAGAMLLKSPNVYSTLDLDIRNESDHLVRWISFLRSRRGADDYLPFIEELPDGARVSHIIGNMNNVPNNSTVLCMECSAYEI